MAVHRSRRMVSPPGQRCSAVLDTASKQVFLVVVGLLTALGMLRLGFVGTVLAAAVSAMFGVLLVRAWYAEREREKAAFLKTGNVVSTSAVGVLALVGAARVQPFGVVLGLTALAAAWLVVRWRLWGLGPLSAPGASGRSGRERPVRAGELADLLGRLPTDVLLGEWQRSERAIAEHHGLAAEAALVELRALLLDELEARDARGFSAWQRASGAQPCSPVRFLSDTEH